METLSRLPPRNNKHDDDRGYDGVDAVGPDGQTKEIDE